MAQAYTDTKYQNWDLLVHFLPEMSIPLLFLDIEAFSRSYA